MMVAFNSIRVLFVSLFVALVVAASGCNQSQSTVGGDDPEHAVDVTVAQLKEITKSDSHFMWFGCDDKFHYFEFQRKFYRMPIKFDIPAVKNLMARKAGLGTGMNVCIEEGKIVYWVNKKKPK